ncbi:hypothetical protein XOC_1259 [Xanthomonas oryzae pv. oryzicola BLS256]|uniref:Uncharacterized protein n=1 Tax=Xanthomonas oryzae pv. oryzicola (strain BLS256) TaxID=383407 RepID=G7TH59_XANOB|nr:hypothetical protein XOC_1259 [Xanthomonas oryzae pv. oryzicola BLS256]QEO98667.1 hypothetical protein XOCgx_3678 [Xanthomonas oryzae pv. oryzicola]
MPDFSVAGNGTLASPPCSDDAGSATGARAGAAAGRDAAPKAGPQIRAIAHTAGRNEVRMQTVLAILAGHWEEQDALA